MHPDPANAPASSLREVGLRVTRPRLAVLEALRDQQHASTEALIESVRSDIGSVSVQTVYDVLAALTEAELVRRIEPAGSPARYEIKRHDNHHHVVCRSCGAVADVPCAIGAAPCLEASATSGFVIDEAEITYWGLCPDCAPPTHQP